MNHTIKPIYFLYLLAFILVFALAACGGGEKAAPAAEPTEQSPTQPVESVSQQPDEPAAVPEVRADIPVLADAVNLTTAAAVDGYSVSYTSASGLDAAAAFYQAQMPPQGWTYDATVVSQSDGITQVLAFQKDSEEAAVTLTQIGNGVQVIIAVSPHASQETVANTAPQPTTPSPEPTAAPVEEPTTTAADVAAGAPDADMAAAVPIMEDATGVVAARENGDYVITYQSSAGVDDIAAFYQSEMPLQNWTYDAGASAALPGVSTELHFNRSDGEAAVSIATIGLATQVVVAVSGAAADAAETAELSGGATSGDSSGSGAAPQPTTAVQPAPTQPPAAFAGSRQDIPLMADATNVDEGVTDDYALTYHSVSNVDDIFTFYKNQMPTYGWAYRADGSVLVPGVTGTIYFNKNGEEITITMSAQGGITLVQAVIN